MSVTTTSEEKKKKKLDVSFTASGTLNEVTATTSKTSSELSIIVTSQTLSEMAVTTTSETLSKVTVTTWHLKN